MWLSIWPGLRPTFCLWFLLPLNVGGGAGEARLMCKAMIRQQQHSCIYRWGYAISAVEAVLSPKHAL
jgi:hypothetical protein